MGYLIESNPGSGIYDQYYGKWTLNGINYNSYSTVLVINGTILRELLLNIHQPDYMLYNR